MRVKLKNLKLRSNKMVLYNNLYSIIKNLYKYINKVKILNNEMILEIKNKENIIFIINFLKNHYKYQCKELVDITTIDYIRPNKRFCLNYFLLSLKYKFRLRIKLWINEDVQVNSITNIYSSANWLERENWDMFGIFFINHPDLRRILTDYGFEGFPFRKDFPLSGYIELRYDDEERVVVYEKLELAQEFRNFDFASPWGWESNLNNIILEKKNKNNE